MLIRLHRAELGGETGNTSVSGQSSRRHKWLWLIRSAILIEALGAWEAAAQSEQAPAPHPAPGVSGIGQVADTLKLTPAEGAWLKEHPVIRYGADPNWPPFSGVDANGTLQGIDVLMLKEVSAHTRVRFVYVPAKNWTDTMRNFREGKVDILLATAKSVEREADFLFTKPYFEFPVALVSRVEAPFLTTMDQLKDLRVAGPRNHITTNMIRTRFPGIELYELESSADCLDMVAKGQADVTVGNLVAMGYQIGAMDLGQLKVAGLMDVQFALRYGVRRDWPELVGILDKSLEQISQERRDQFVSATIAPELQKVAQRSTRRRQAEWAALVGLVLASALGWLAFTLFRQIRRRNRHEAEMRAQQETLEAMVAERTAELTKANARLQSEITERERTTAVLRKSEEKFSTLFLSLPDGALVSTLDKGVILDVNPAFCQCTGYLEEELIGRTSLELNLWANAADRKRLVNAIRDREETVGFEANFRRKDGALVPVHFSSRRVDIEGLHCLIGVARELTEIRRVEQQRQKLEEQLRQAQKMEALGRLTGGVAHDFNNLLQVMQGNVLMLREAEDAMERELFLDGLMEASERAAGLTRQLLSFSRGQPLLRKEKVDLDALMRSEIRMLQRVMPEAIEITYECEGASPCIEGDRTQLSQVIMNLCVNARDAMPEGGTLRIELDTVPADDVLMDLHALPDSSVLARIRISDSGIGMDEDTKARIFEPFFSTKGSDRGTGLGLAVVYGVVEKHGGHIQVTSQPGMGTTFTLHFPSSSALPAQVAAGQNR